MNRKHYSRLFIYTVFLLLMHSIGYGQVSLINSGTSNVCFGSSVTLTTNAPFSAYLWSTGETTASISAGSAGAYFVTVTDSLANNYQSDTINISIISMSLSAGITDLICNGDQDGEVDITVSGGNNPYTYTWSDGSTDEDIYGLAGGAYTVMVTDSNGCSLSATYTVSEPLAIVITHSITAVSCSGGSDGAVDITVSGGSGSYVFDWSNGATIEDIAGLAANTYTVDVSDINGCPATDVSIVPDGTVVTVSISGNSPVCPGFNSTLDAGSGYNTYLWSEGSTTQTISVPAGSYTVTVSNGSGCTAVSAPFILTEFSAPVVSITAGGATTFCDGGSVTLTATTGFSSYQWSSGEFSESVSATSDGAYTVTVMDVNGCTATASQTVTVYPNPFLDVITLSDVLCKDDGNGIIEIAGNGGTAPYLYDLNNSGFSSITLFDSLQPGIYDITVQDANGCSSMTQFFINEPNDYLGASYLTTDVLCNGASTGVIDLTVTGGTLPYYFQWSNAATTEDLTDLVAGIYTVTVTDANGCEILFAIDVFEPVPLIAGQDYTNVSCFGGSDGTAIVFVSGGVPPYEYSWDTNPVQTDFLAFNLDAGLHTCTITDSNGCVITSTFLIAEPSELIATSSVTDVTCYGYSDGSATASVTGGTPYQTGSPYQYSWNTIPVQSTVTATGLEAGSYTVIITDSTGCVENLVVTVNEPNPLMASTSNVNVLCFGGNNGESTTIVTGGTAPYNYSWNTVPVQTTLVATGLSAGFYTVTITDANGCNTTANALISQPNNLSLNGSILPVTCNGGSDGKVLLIVSGGNFPYSFFWNSNPVQTTASLLNVPAGSYTVIVTDDKGCTQSATYSITQPGKINANETITSPVCFGGNTGSISINPSGGVIPYTVIWSTGNTTNNISMLAAGSYTVTITDASLCVETRTMVITSPPDITVTTTLSHVSCSGGSNGSALLTVSGGLAPYTYLWSNGASTAQVSGLNAAIYTVTVTDANGCSKTAVVIINQPSALSCICNSNVNHVSCFGGSDGSITAFADGGTPPYSYLWSNGQMTQTANGLTAGTYTVTITDANGCQAVGVITINQPPVLSVFATAINISCGGAGNGSSNALVAGGTPPYSFSWNTVPAQTGQTATGLTPGTYTVIVTDSKNCTAQSSATITQPSSISCSTSATNATCFGSATGTATVTATGGSTPYTYQWSTSPVKTTATVIGLAAGTYTVTITDAQGCTKTCQATVSQPAALVSLYVPVNVLCYGGNNGAIDLTVTGGTSPYTYSWSTGATTQDLSGISAGIYTVLITDHKGCNISSSINITQPSSLNCNAVSTNVSCFGGVNGTASVSVSGGVAPYGYLWSNGNTTSSTSGLSAGSYSVIITDYNGCTSVCSTLVTQPAVLQCSINTCCDTILCFGEHTGALDVLVTGGSPPYTYVWNTTPVQTTMVASGLGAGSYTVTVTDSKGCTTTCSYTLTQPALLTCSAVAGPVSCNGAGDGTASVIISGGTAPFTYVWNTLIAQTTATATGLSPGTYTVFVSDANGCTTSCQATVTEPAILLVSITHTNVSCNGVSDGTATAVVSGGTTPYSFLWSNGETTSAIINLSAGNYTVTVTDAHSCSATASVTINQGSALSCSITSTNISCFGGTNGTATVFVTGGVAPLSYTWNTAPAQFTVTATGLASGTYTVIVTDASGCSTTCSATLTEPSALSCTTVVIQHVTCFGGQDGSASVSPAGGVPPYSFSWNTAPVQTNATATGLAEGSYSVSVTDANGCTSTCTVKIDEPAALSCAATGTSTHCGNDDGTASVNATGGVPPYSYLWSNGATTSGISGLSFGTYTVTVTDDHGCTTSCDYNVTASSSLIAVTSKTDVTCHGGADGTASITVAGGDPPYTYLWNTIPAQTTDTATGLTAGTYTVIAADINGCTITKTVTIQEPTAIVVTMSGVTDVLCYGTPTGSATASVSGGLPPYSFLWSDGQTNQTATGLAAGTYTVTVSDFSNCSATAAITISQPGNALSVSETHTGVTCNGGINGSIDITVSGGTPAYTYSWSSGQTTEDIGALPAGTYTVTVTDQNACTASLTVMIGEPAAMSCSVAGTKPTCYGGQDGSAQVSLTGGTAPFAYLWSNGQTTSTATGLAAGTYTITVTDSNGCSTSCQVVLADPLQLLVNITKNKDVSCYNGNDASVEANPVGGTAPYAYVWSTGATTKVLNNLPSGTYTVTVTDDAGCTASASVTVNQPSGPLAIGESHTDVDCYGNNNGSINITVSGGTPSFTYSWSNGQTTEDIGTLPAGTYTVYVTDANGCTAFLNITINGPQNPLSLTETHQDLTCNGVNDGSIDLTVSGGTPVYSYSWSNGATSQDIAGLSTGTYTVVVTDANGCTATLSATINGITAIIINVVSDDPGCYNGSDGFATANVSGGTPPYSFLWSDGQTTMTAVGLPAGNYMVTVTDASGCTATATALINNPASLQAGIINIVHVSCFGGATGSAEATASGGSVPYDFIWSNGATTAVNGGLSAGTYTVTVTDQHGCTASASVVISGPLTPLSLFETHNHISCHNGADGSIDLTVSGGTPAYTYAWSNGSTTEDITGLPHGTYTVTVTDAGGCTATLSVTLDQPVLLTCQVNGNKPACYGGNDGNATVSASGGTPGYSYLWSNGQTTATATGLAAGTYTVTVTDSKGCNTSCNITLTQPAQLTVTVNKTKDVSCNGSNDGSAEAFPSGGESPYAYLWSNGATTKVVTGLSAGTYTVIVSDANGCTGSASITLTQPSLITATTNAVNVSCHGGNDGQAQVTSVFGGTPPYSFLWSTIPVQTTTGATGLGAGSYTVTITDQNGCTLTKTILVTEPPALSCSTSSTNATCSGNNGSVSVSASGGSPGYGYLWNTIPAKTTTTVTGLAPGTYTVVVTDSKGCTSSCSAVVSGSPGNISCSISKTDASCHGGNNGAASVSVTGGTAPFTYQWNTVPVQTNAVATGLSAGNYQVLVTDANGCTTVCSTTIGQPSAIFVGFTKIVQVACNGGSNGTVEANPSGGTPWYTFLWSNGQTIPFIQTLSAGTYTVTVTDANGCTNTGSVTINEPAPLTCSIAVTNAGCNQNNGSATVTATGGTGPYGYAWNTSPVKTTQTITGLSPGTYSVMVTDAHGCTSICSATVGGSSFSLSLNSPTYIGGKNIRCYGDFNGSINLTVSGASGPVTYLWSNGATTEDLSGLGAGTYTVTVTSNNCTATASKILTQPAALNITFTKTNVSCKGGSDGMAKATVKGGNSPYTYSWNTIPVKTTQQITGLTAGVYVVTAADANGCTISAAVTITQPSALTINGVKSNVSCNGGNNGSLNITVSGGTSPYNFIWNNGSSSEDRSGLQAGTYTVTVTDKKGCTKSATFIIYQPNVLSGSIIQNSGISCQGSCTGSLTASGSGGTSPYTYSWNTNPVKTTATITGLCAGTYTVTITDNKGCVYSKSKTLSAASTITIALSGINVTTNGGSNGSATATPSGGISPYAYSWNTSPVKTTQTITGLVAGTYTVTITDAAGCTKTGSVTITQPAPCQSFKTYTIGGWGASPNGNNAGTYLAANFTAAFPNGLSIGSCGREIRLLTSTAIVNFLPSTGTPRRLNAGILTNPTSASYGNTFASQLVALKLNITFDAWDPNFAPTSTTLLQDMIIGSGPYMGWTVLQLYNEANTKIGCGGCTSSQFSSLNNAVTLVNQSWDNGININGFLVCPGNNNLRPSASTETPDDPITTNLKVFPNPSNGFVNLEFLAEGSLDFRLSVVDLTGREVFTDQTAAENGFNARFYDLSYLPRGVYLLQVFINGQAENRRIIIQ